MALGQARTQLEVLWSARFSKSQAVSIELENLQCLIGGLILGKE